MNIPLAVSYTLYIFELSNPVELKHRIAMINTINYKGIDRQIVIEGDDIQLQSIAETIVIEGGWYDLQRECEDHFRAHSDDRGRPVRYDRDMVYQFAIGELAGYALTHADEGLILSHSVN